MNPIYGASIRYHVFEFTTLSLSADRTVSSALQQNQINESTAVSLAVSQRLLGVLKLTVSGGFSSNDYIGADSALDVHRQDDTIHFAATLGYQFTQRGNASIFFNYSDNSSSSGGFSYASSQIGLQVGYHF